MRLEDFHDDIRELSDEELRRRLKELRAVRVDTFDKALAERPKRAKAQANKDAHLAKALSQLTPQQIESIRKSLSGGK